MHKKRLQLFLLFSIGFLTYSCTILQWRESDAEIYERFANLPVDSKIDYYVNDSLNLKIRSQHITKPTNKINIIFFHGSPSSLSAWNKYLLDTTRSKKANLIAIDRPGYGYSKFGKELPEIEPQAIAMSKLIEYYNLENVITIGSSYGGPLAARVAVLNKRVKGAILISPAIDPHQEKKIWASRFTQWWLTRWLVPTGYRVAGDEKTIHANEMAKIEANWHTLTIPVLHIHGAIDDLVPYTNVEYTKEKFPNIEIITIPNAGHEIAWAKPQLILPHIYKMIEKMNTLSNTTYKLK